MKHIRDDVRSIPDSFTHDGAVRHAKMIEAYWAKLGRPVSVRLQPASLSLRDKSERNDIATFVVRSNLGLYLPEKVTR